MSDRDIQQVEFAGYKFETWYKSVGYFEQNPTRKSCHSADTISDLPIETLYVCRTCFKYTIDRKQMYQHEHLCKFRGKPPGKRLYRDMKYSIRLVNGLIEPMFCQCLCLFSRLFLDSKTIYFNVSAFEFYVLYEDDTALGFYSREKNSWEGYNLACILIFPPFQSYGLGKLLIGFSYYITKCENKTGSPEKPLSSYGHAGYLSYWCLAVARALLVDLDNPPLSGPTICINDISKLTGIIPQDVEEALHHMKALNKKSISLMAVQNYVKSHNMSLVPLINPAHCTV